MRKFSSKSIEIKFRSGEFNPPITAAVPNLVVPLLSKLYYGFSMSKATNEHIAPHRAWAIQRAGDEIDPSEQAHLLECDWCVNLLRICANAESFGAVLRELNEPPRA